MTVSIEIEVEPSRVGLDRTKDNLGDLSEPLAAVVRNWRGLIAQEFRTAAWRPQSGAVRPWPPLRNGGVPTLGPLGAAWGGGVGGFTNVSRETASFGITGPIARWAGVHRGDGTAAGSRRPHRQKMSAKQRAFLAIRAKELGIEFTGRPEGHPDRGFMITPRRTHATINPEIRTRATAIFAAHAAGRPLPEELAA